MVVTLQSSQECLLCTSSGRISSEQQIESDVKRRVSILF